MSPSSTDSDVVRKQLGFSPYGFSPSTQAFKASTSNFLFHQQLNTSIIVLALYRPISKGRIPTQPTWG